VFFLLELQTMSTRYSDTTKETTSIGDVVADLTGKVEEFQAHHLKRLEALEIKLDTPTFGPSGRGKHTELAKGLDAFYRKGDTTLMREKAMSIGTDASGGYLHVPELARQILAAVGEEVAIFRDVTQRMTDTNEYRQVYTVTGASAGRSAEGGTRNATNTPELARVDIPLYDLYSYVSLSQELVDSAEFDTEAYVRIEIQRQFAEAIETEIISGSGSTAGLGILTQATSTALDTDSPERPFGTFQYVAGGINSPLSSFNYDSLVDLVAALPVRYKRNAKFYASTSGIQHLRKLKDSQNMPIWRDANGGVAGAPQSVMGYPVVECEGLPDVAINSKPILFGDMAASYMWVTHNRGLRIVRDNVTTPGTIKLYASLQCSGKPGDTRALKALSIS
jgi:HK97 family phage major capsid protein